VLLSTVLIAVVPILAKLANEGGSNTLTLISARSVLSVLAVSSLLWLAEKPFAIGSFALVTSLCTGVAYGIMLYCYLEAVNFLAVNLVILIFFIHPLLVSLMTVAIGEDKLQLVTVLAPVAALGGLAMAMGFSFGQVNSTGLMLATLAMLLAAFVIVGNARAMLGAPALSVVFYMMVSAAVSLGIIFVAIGHLALPATAIGWTSFLGTAVAATAGTLTFFVGMEYVGTSRATMITNLEPVFGVAFAVTILGEKLAAIQFVGIAIVIGAIIAMERRRAYADSTS
jgi:drug/metabolite transporter (DMT)-like permease